MHSMPTSELETLESLVSAAEDLWVMERWAVHTTAGTIEASVVRHISDSMKEMHMLNGSTATGGVRAELLTTELVSFSE